jgi:hypothetical protein
LIASTVAVTAAVTSDKRHSDNAMSHVTFAERLRSRIRAATPGMGRFQFSVDRSSPVWRMIERMKEKR